MAESPESDQACGRVDQRDRSQRRCGHEHGRDESGDFRSTGRQRESVALVDLDMHGGDLGLFLDLHAVSRVETSLKGHLPAR